MSSTLPTECEMMSNLKEPSNFDVAKCSICLDHFKEPKYLPCMHTFCLGCLDKYAKDKTHNAMDCPLCRKKFAVPDGGFEKLPDNIVIKDLMEQLKICQENPNEIKCYMCLDSLDAKSLTAKYCVNCGQHLCEKCTAYHGRVPQLRFHKLVSMEDKTSSIIKFRIINCEVHLDKQLEIYCTDCNKPICLTCKALDHDRHTCTHILISSQNCIKQIEGCYPGLQNCVTATQEEMNQQNAAKEVLLKMTSDTREAINKTADDLIALVEAERKELLDQLKAFEIERLKAMETRLYECMNHSEIIERFKKYSLELTEHGSPVDILHSANDLVARAKDLIGSQVEFNKGQLMKDQVAFIPAHSTDIVDGTRRTVGALAFNDEVRLKTLLENCPPLHVIPSKGKTIGLTGFGNELFVLHEGSKHVTVYSVLDFVETRKIVVPELSDPHGFAACQHHNCLYISEVVIGRIHRVDMSNSSVTKWPMDGGSRGLSVTTYHHLLVTLWNLKTICEYTTLGSLVREINLDVSIDYPWHSIELPSGQFVVCHESYTQHRVCIVDTSGSIVRSYGGPKGSSAGQLCGPHWLAVDKRGCIYVVDWSNSTVRIISSTLTHLGDVSVQERQLGNVYCLHLDEVSGRLYIGQWRDSSIFVLPAI